MSEMVLVPQVNDGAGGATTHGTPEQFSKAAFFQRTLISSRLYNAFLLISNGCFSLTVLPLIGISNCEFVCAIPIKGSSKRGKNLIVILAFLGLKYSQICTQLSAKPILVQTNPFKF